MGEAEGPDASACLAAGMRGWKAVCPAVLKDSKAALYSACWSAGISSSEEDEDESEEEG